MATTAWYQFENNLNDTSGNGRNGSAVGAGPTFEGWSESTKDKILSQEGSYFAKDFTTSNYATVPTSVFVSGMDVAGMIKVSFYIPKWNSMGDDKHILSLTTTSNGNFNLYVRADRRVRCDFPTAGGMSGAESLQGYIQWGRWYTVWVCWNATNKLRIYLADQEETCCGVQYIAVSTTTPNFSSVTGINVGVSASVLLPFNGLIDNLEFFDTPSFPPSEARTVNKSIYVPEFPKLPVIYEDNFASKPENYNLWQDTGDWKMGHIYGQVPSPTFNVSTISGSKYATMDGRGAWAWTYNVNPKLKNLRNFRMEFDRSDNSTRLVVLARTRENFSGFFISFFPTEYAIAKNNDYPLGAGGYFIQDNSFSITPNSTHTILEVWNETSTVIGIRLQMGTNFVRTVYYVNATRDISFGSFGFVGGYTNVPVRNIKIYPLVVKEDGIALDFKTIQEKGSGDSLILYDTFTDVDNQPLSNHKPDYCWQPDQKWEDPENTWKISGNELIKTGTSETSYNTVNLNLGCSSYKALFKLYVDNVGSYDCSFTLRKYDISYVKLQFHSTSGGQIFVRGTDNNIYAILGKSLFGGSPAWHDVEVVVLPNKISVRFDTTYMEWVGAHQYHVEGAGIGFTCWTGCSPKIDSLRVFKLGTQTIPYNETFEGYSVGTDMTTKSWKLFNEGATSPSLLTVSGKGIKPQTGGSGYCSWRYDDPKAMLWTDYSFEFDVTSWGTANHICAFFRWNVQGGFFLFQTSTNFSIYRFLGLGPMYTNSLLRTYTVSPGTHYKVTCRGAHIDIEVDGVIVASLHTIDANYLSNSGSVGLGCGLPTTDATYDNLKVTLLNEDSISVVGVPSISETPKFVDGAKPLLIDNFKSVRKEETMGSYLFDGTNDYIRAYDYAAIDFDGVSTYASVTNNPMDLDLANSDFTISFLIKATSFSGSGFIMVKGYGGYGFQVKYSANKIQLVQNINTYASTWDLTDNTWNRVTIVRSGYRVYFYKDDGTPNVVSMTAGIYEGSAYTFYLGRDNGGTSYLLGQLSEIMIFRRALLSSEVLDIYNFRKVKNNLVAYWKGIDPDTGSTLTDEVGTHNGTLYNWSSASLSLKTNPFPTGDSSRSIAMWVNPSRLTGDQVLGIWGAYSENNMWGLGLLSSNPTKVSVWAYNHDVTGTKVLSTSTWYHVVATYDSSTGALKTYIDNALDINTTTTDYNTSSGKFSIGATLEATPQYFFQGYLADIRVYNKCLTADEVKKLYGFHNITDGLVFYAKCGERSGLNILDKSGNENDGRAYGITASTFFSTSVPEERLEAHIPDYSWNGNSWSMPTCKIKITKDDYATWYSGDWVPATLYNVGVEYYLIKVRMYCDGTAGTCGIFVASPDSGDTNIAALFFNNTQMQLNIYPGGAFATGAYTCSVGWHTFYFFRGKERTTLWDSAWNVIFNTSSPLYPGLGYKNIGFWRYTGASSARISLLEVYDSDVIKNILLAQSGAGTVSTPSILASLTRTDDAEGTEAISEVLSQVPVEDFYTDGVIDDPYILAEVPVADQYPDGEQWIQEDESILAEVPVGETTSPKVKNITGFSFPLNNAVGGGHCWVTDANQHTVTKINSAGFAVLESANFGGQIEGVSYGFGSVWAVNDGLNLLYRLDPDTLEIEASIDLSSGVFAAGCICSDSYVYVVCTALKAVKKIDPTTNSVVATISINNGVYCSPDNGLAYDPRGYLYVPERDQHVAKIKLSDNTVTYIEMPNPSTSATLDAAVGDSYIYIADLGNGCIVKINKNTDAVEGTISVGNGNAPYGLDYKNGVIAVGISNGDFTVKRIDAITEEIIESVWLGMSPHFVKFLDNDLFVTVWSTGNYVSKVLGDQQSLSISAQIPSSDSGLGSVGNPSILAEVPVDDQYPEGEQGVVEEQEILAQVQEYDCQIGDKATLIFNDSCTDTELKLLDLHVPEIGSSWTDPDDAFHIKNNQIRGKLSSGSHWCRNNIGSGLMVFEFESYETPGWYVSVSFRANSILSQCYYVVSAPTLISLGRNPGGVWLASGDTKWVTGGKNKIQIYSLYDRILVFHNGKLLIDYNIPTAGDYFSNSYIGLWYDDITVDSHAIWDNFKIYRLGQTPDTRVIKDLSDSWADSEALTILGSIPISDLVSGSDSSFLIGAFLEFFELMSGSDFGFPGIMVSEDSEGAVESPGILSMLELQDSVVPNKHINLYTGNDSSSTVLSMTINGVLVFSITLSEDDVVFSNPLPFIFMIASNFGTANFPTSGYWKEYLDASLVIPQPNGTLYVRIPSGHEFYMQPHGASIGAVMIPPLGVTNPGHPTWPQYPLIHVYSTINENFTVELGDSWYEGNVIKYTEDNFSILAQISEADQNESFTEELAFLARKRLTEIFTGVSSVGVSTQVPVLDSDSLLDLVSIFAELAIEDEHTIISNEELFKVYCMFVTDHSLWPSDSEPVIVSMVSILDNIIDAASEIASLGLFFAVEDYSYVAQDFIEILNSFELTDANLSSDELLDIFAYYIQVVDDLGTLAEELAFSCELSLEDISSGSDVFDILASISIPDTNTMLTELLDIFADVTISDANSVAEELYILFGRIIFDSSVSSEDFVGIFGSVDEQDTNESVTDELSILANVGVGDALVLGIETLGLLCQMAIDDNNSSVSELILQALPYLVYDSNTEEDESLEILENVFAVFEEAEATDLTSVFAQINILNEYGYAGSEVLSAILLVNLLDDAEFSETLLFVLANIFIQDSGMFVEFLNIVCSLLVLDTGLALDLIAILNQVVETDSSTSHEELVNIFVQIAQLDSGLATELLAKLSQLGVLYLQSKIFFESKIESAVNEAIELNSYIQRFGRKNSKFSATGD